MTLNPTAEKVAGLLEPHVERQGYELVSVEFKKGARGSMLRLLVDKPGGGISLSDLEKLSPVLGDLLDVYDPIEGRYLLEVASPGLNRPLNKLEHFESCRGQRIKVKTSIAREGGQKMFVGKLVEVRPGGIELDDETSGHRQSFEFNEIQNANFEYDFNN